MSKKTKTMLVQIPKETWIRLQELKLDRFRKTDERVALGNLIQEAVDVVFPSQDAEKEIE